MIIAIAAILVLPGIGVSVSAVSAPEHSSVGMADPVSMYEASLSDEPVALEPLVDAAVFWIPEDDRVITVDTISVENLQNLGYFEIAVWLPYTQESAVPPTAGLIGYDSSGQVFYQRTDANVDGDTPYALFIDIPYVRGGTFLLLVGDEMYPINPFDADGIVEYVVDVVQGLGIEQLPYEDIEALADWLVAFLNDNNPCKDEPANECIEVQEPCDYLENVPGVCGNPFNVCEDVWAQTPVVCEPVPPPCSLVGHYEVPGTCGHPPLDKCDIMQEKVPGQCGQPPLCEGNWDEPSCIPSVCDQLELVGDNLPYVCGGDPIDECDYLRFTPGFCGNPLPCDRNGPSCTAPVTELVQQVIALVGEFINLLQSDPGINTGSSDGPPDWLVATIVGAVITQQQPGIQPLVDLPVNTTAWLGSVANSFSKSMSSQSGSSNPHPDCQDEYRPVRVEVDTVGENRGKTVAKNPDTVSEWRDVAFGSLGYKLRYEHCESGEAIEGKFLVNFAWRAQNGAVQPAGDGGQLLYFGADYQGSAEGCITQHPSQDCGGLPVQFTAIRRAGVFLAEDPDARYSIWAIGDVDGMARQQCASGARLGAITGGFATVAAVMTGSAWVGIIGGAISMGVTLVESSFEQCEVNWDNFEAESAYPGSGTRFNQQAVLNQVDVTGDYEVKWLSHGEIPLRVANLFHVDSYGHPHHDRGEQAGVHSKVWFWSHDREVFVAQGVVE